MAEAVYAGSLGGSGKPTRIVHISDSHCKHRDFTDVIPDGDVLIHSGDFAMKYMSAENGRELLADLDDWFASLPHPSKILVAGNHDSPLRDLTPEQIQELLPNAVYLQDAYVDAHGLRFYGAPWNNATRGEYMFGLHERERASHWSVIPAGVDVLITHMPPFGILDRSLSRRGTDEVCEICSEVHPSTKHDGCKALRNEVQSRVRPRVHLFGHVHGDKGAMSMDGTLYINSAVDVHSVIHYFDIGGEDDDSASDDLSDTLDAPQDGTISDPSEEEEEEAQTDDETASLASLGSFAAGGSGAKSDVSD